MTTLTTLQEKMREELTKHLDSYDKHFDEGFYAFNKKATRKMIKESGECLIRKSSQAISTAYSQCIKDTITATEIFDEGEGTDMAIILADELKEELLIHTK